MNFRQWLEVGGSVWIEPPKEKPTKVGGTNAFTTVCGPEERDPSNPEGQLPPVKKKMK
jgi:hypothetical protein